MTSSYQPHTTIVGVILPVRNEGAVIERCLRGLAAQECEATIRVAVCVNGTTDDTLAKARALGAELNRVGEFEAAVLEVAQASKTAALNAGDQWIGDADVWMYLDADVELSRNAVASLVAALAPNTPLLAQPSRTVAADTRGIGRVAAHALLALPWVAEDVACGGIFAVNRAGRTRWKEYPRIAADDAYVFGHFAPSERRIVHACTATHPMPNSLRGLLRQQRRWGEARAALQVSEYRPQYGSGWSASRRARALLRSPRALFGAVIMRLVRMNARLAASGLTRDSWHVDRVRTQGEGGCSHD